MFYKNAITRKPGINFNQGITTSNLGAPDFFKAMAQHAEYVKTLESEGITVKNLESDINYPDGCFVEDTAVIFPEAAIITNPGAASRKGEIVTINKILNTIKELHFIDHPGTLEGGDVLKIEKKFYIGISERTNKEGIRQFAEITKKFGYETYAISLEEILHLKTGIAYIGNNTIIGWPGVLKQPEFAQYQKIEIPPDELYASNCIRLAEDTLIIPKGFPKTNTILSNLNYKVIELDMSEFEKMDGGLTCLSLLYN